LLRRRSCTACSWCRQGGPMQQAVPVCGSDPRRPVGRIGSRGQSGWW
jgi:hypothetical protein